MGAQWEGMARTLMTLDVFKSSILKCSDALRKLGMDPFSMLMNPDDTAIFQTTINCMVCNCAVQVQSYVNFVYKTVFRDSLSAVSSFCSITVSVKYPYISKLYDEGCNL